MTNVLLSPKRANIQSDTDQGDNEQLQNAKRIKIPLEEMKSVDMDFVQLTARTLDLAGPKTKHQNISLTYLRQHPHLWSLDTETKVTGFQHKCFWNVSLN